MTQAEQILNHMETKGAITPLEALASEITETARAGRLDGVAECLAAFDQARARILAALEERP